MKGWGALMKRFNVAVTKEDGGVEIYPMKEWLRRHADHVPAGLDATSSTSHQLREGLLRRGWSLEETLFEVRLRPPPQGASDPSANQGAERVPAKTGANRRGPIDEAVLQVASPHRFREKGGLEWTDYCQALKILDDGWRARRYRHASFGVFGPRPSWEDTISRGAALFDLESWSELNDEQLSLIAPAHYFQDGDALLGSVLHRNPAIRSFLLAEEKAKDRNRILSHLKDARTMKAPSIPLVGGDILAEMCEVRGMGRSFATRLLALARPDAFVVVNKKSQYWLRQATELSMTGTGPSYSQLLKWLAGQKWYHASPPDDPLDQRLWLFRAALLDAFAYEPEQ
jgi:hypothetical protein